MARLAGALNAMLDRLETAFADKEASEAKLRQFVADASHELRTPLSAVLGYAELVQTGMASSPDQVDHAVGRIAAEGERMRMMVEELLMLARLDHGRPANPTRSIVGELARVAAADAIGDRAGPADGRCTSPTATSIVIADAAALAPGDRQPARQHPRPHAARHARSTSPIERRGGDVAIVVDDEGPGIDHRRRGASVRPILPGRAFPGPRRQPRRRRTGPVDRRRGGGGSHDGVGQRRQPRPPAAPGSRSDCPPRRPEPAQYRGFMALREYLIEEVALDCAEGLLSRRDAIRRLGLLGVGGAAAAAMIAAVPSSVAARTSSTEPPEPDGSTAPLAPGEDITFPGTSGDLIGVFSAADQPLGCVLVIHENRGLTPHIRTIPPRLAADGYSALAIDLISAEGGTASMPTEDEAMAALGAAPEERLIADLRSGSTSSNGAFPTRSSPRSGSASGAA